MEHLSCVSFQKAHSLKWDAWVNNTIVEKIKSLSRLEFRNMFYTKEMARLKGGLFIIIRAEF